LRAVAAVLGPAFVVAVASKIGIVTGQSLPQICRERCGPAMRWGLWLQAELIAMATDLAEVVDAAIGLNLLLAVRRLSHPGTIPDSLSPGSGIPQGSSRCAGLARGAKLEA
jgi:NRAMP (natural resistance-associated macrophage protein)-like metal ion transporter